MNIVLLGAPGSGKGTQASKIVAKYNIPHISTGDIFRENIKNATPIGVIAKSYIDKGQLVPDEVTDKIVAERITRKDCKNGFLLDGYPRNLAQAEALAKVANIDVVLDIEVDEAKLLRRITGRRICTKCGESFHIDFIGDAKTCSKCGADLYIRADDNEETVNSRLQVYRAQTQPLIDYYDAQHCLHRIVGDNTVDGVFHDIQLILDTEKVL